MESTGDHFATVRSRAVWPAIAAALMLYFAWPPSAWLIPEEPAAKIARHLFVYTLLIGGVVMAIVAAWLCIGQRIALAVDGIASMLIGLLLCGTGVLFLIGGYTSNAINILFGLMFFFSGRGSYVDYMALGQVGLARPSSLPERSDGPRAASRAPQPVNLPHRLVNEPNERQESQPIAPPPKPLAPPLPSDRPSESAPAGVPQPASEPPPEGFLAQFADDKA